MNGSWMLSAICSILYSFVGSKSVREKFYRSLKNNHNLILYPWLKSVCSKEGSEEVEGIKSQGENKPQKEEAPKDHISEIYNMYNRG
ncbi:unnamed protein product [Sphagnum balticum]